MSPQYQLAAMNPYMAATPPGYPVTPYGGAYPALFTPPPPPGMGVMDPYGNYVPPNIAASLARGYADGFDAYRGRDHCEYHYLMT